MKSSALHCLVLPWSRLAGHGSPVTARRFPNGGATSVNSLLQFFQSYFRAVIPYCCVVFQILGAISFSASAQTTAFTYQGRLNNGTNPASGNYDLTFTLFGTVSGAGQVGNTVTNSTAMTNGLFTVTLDFGNQFPGADRWLEIAVRTNGGVSFTPLSPRQPLTPTPYALTAANFNGAIAIAQLPANVITNGASGVNFSGTFSGNLAGLTNLLALDDGVLDTDTNVNYFVKSVANITTTQERNDIAGLIAEMKRGGIWDLLADGVILKTNYGASASSVKTLLGRTAFIRSLPGFTEFGAINPSLSISNLPYDLRTNTIVVVLKQRGDGGGAQGNVSGVAKNLAGVYAGIGDGVRLCVDASYGTIWRKATVETSPYAFIVSESVPAISGGIGVFQDGKRRTFAVALQGTNATPYVDGAAAGTFAGVFSTAPTGLAAMPLTNLWIGSDPAGGFQLDAEVAAVLVFTNALNAAQIVSAEKALRWLEPATENWAVFGDSRAIMSSFVTIDNTTVFWTNGWPSILSRMGRLSRSSVWYNHGISGASSGQWVAGATDFPFLSNLFQVAAPGGKVMRSHMLVQLGANDLLFDASDSFRVNMQYILSLVKSNGFETWVFTEPAQGTNLIYGPWNDGRRLTNNLWLRTHRELYDHLVERELSFPPGSMDLTNNVNALSKDGLHLSYNGNVRQAQQIYDILNGTPTTFASYVTNGAINASLDANGNFTGNGQNLVNLDASQLTAGIIPAARINFTGNKFTNSIFYDAARTASYLMVTNRTLLLPSNSSQTNSLCFYSVVDPLNTQLSSIGFLDGALVGSPAGRFSGLNWFPYHTGSEMELTIDSPGSMALGWANESLLGVVLQPNRSLQIGINPSEYGRLENIYIQGNFNSYANPNMGYAIPLSFNSAYKSNGIYINQLMTLWAHATTTNGESRLTLYDNWDQSATPDLKSHNFANSAVRAEFITKSATGMGGLDVYGRLWSTNFVGDGSGLTNLSFTGYTNAVPPTNTTVVKAWLNFTNATGGVFKMPLYQ